MSSLAVGAYTSNLGLGSNDEHRIDYPDGRHYVGQVKTCEHGKMNSHGYGKLVDNKWGTIYGRFENGKLINSEGTVIKYSRSGEYRGEAIHVKDGFYRPNGQGTFFKTNKVYQGTFAKGDFIKGISIEVGSKKTSISNIEDFSGYQVNMYDGGEVSEEISYQSLKNERFKFYSQTTYSNGGKVVSLSTNPKKDLSDKELDQAFEIVRAHAKQVLAHLKPMLLK